MSEDTRTSLEHFLNTSRLVMKAQQVPHNPNREDDDKWEADHWFVTLNTSRRQMSLYFSMGIGLRKPKKFDTFNRAPQPVAPTIASVLYCLAADASGIENARTFEEWAGEYGYDVDSRSAHRTYKHAKRQTEKLRALLGREWYELLLWNTENDG